MCDSQRSADGAQHRFAYCSGAGRPHAGQMGTHGDHPIVALYPSTVPEVFDLTVKAFNISERLRVPVIFLWTKSWVI